MRYIVEVIAMIFTASLLLGCVTARQHDLPSCDGRQTGIDHVRLLVPGWYPRQGIEIRRIGKGPGARIEIDVFRVPLGVLMAQHVDVLQLAQALAERMGPKTPSSRCLARSPFSERSRAPAASIVTWKA